MVSTIKKKHILLITFIVLISVIIGLVVDHKNHMKWAFGIDTTAAKVQYIVYQLWEFKNDTGRYPTNDENLAALISNPGIKNWKGPYFRRKDEKAIAGDFLFGKEPNIDFKELILDEDSKRLQYKYKDGVIQISKQKSKINALTYCSWSGLTFAEIDCFIPENERDNP